MQNFVQVFIKLLQVQYCSSVPPLEVQSDRHGIGLLHTGGSKDRIISNIIRSQKVLHHINLQKLNVFHL